MIKTKIKKIPYKCHVLVCINHRESERKSCADSHAIEIRQKLKDAITDMGWSKKDVRVSQTKCLGLCEAGPNVMIYPQNLLFNHVTLEHIPAILQKIEEILDQ